MGDTQVKMFGAFSTIFRLSSKEMLIDEQSSDTDKVLWPGKMSISNSAFSKSGCNRASRPAVMITVLYSLYIWIEQELLSPTWP